MRLIAENAKLVQAVDAAERSNCVDADADADVDADVDVDVDADADVEALRQELELLRRDNAQLVQDKSALSHDIAGIDWELKVMKAHLQRQIDILRQTEEEKCALALQLGECVCRTRSRKCLFGQSKSGFRSTAIAASSSSALASGPGLGLAAGSSPSGTSFADGGMEDDVIGNMAMYDEDMEHDFYANRMDGDRNIDGDDVIEGDDGLMGGGGLHTPWQDRHTRCDGASAHHAVAAHVSRDNYEVTFDARADAAVDVSGFELDPILGIEISDEFLEDLRLLTTDDPDGATMLDADQSVDLLESYLRRAEEQHMFPAAAGAGGGGRVEAPRSRRTDQSSSHRWDAQQDEENSTYDRWYYRWPRQQCYRANEGELSTKSLPQ
jgi:hypothetical protein